MDNTLILSPDGKVLEGVRDKSIKSVVVPDSVTEIGGRAFSETKWLEERPKGLVIINDILYSCTDKETTSVDIPNSVTKIGDAAFEGCTSLKSVDIPNSVTAIGYFLFANLGW